MLLYFRFGAAHNPVHRQIMQGAASCRRSQVARLEGVQALPVPPHLAASQSAEPPVGMRCGSCHSDRCAPPSPTLPLPVLQKLQPAPCLASRCC